jgi:hypothetical protein
VVGCEGEVIRRRLAKEVGASEDKLSAGGGAGFIWMPGSDALRPAYCTCMCAAGGEKAYQRFIQGQRCLCVPLPDMGCKRGGEIYGRT